MAFFRKRTADNAEPQARPRFGPGRKLASDQDVRTCFGTIGGVLDVNAPTRYQHMPTLYEAAVTWYGGQPLPNGAWTCTYAGDEVFVFVVWAQTSGTEIGLFPLGGSEESLNTPLIGQWKQADQSLRSIGRIESGQLTLLTPEVGVDYFEDILRLAGKPVTPGNVATIAEQVNQMFAAKAYEYISGVGRDERAATRFVDNHRWNGDIGLPQKVLADLGEWNYQVVPYIQDLPWRVRGILLEPGPDGHSTADVWQRM